jgi:inner membrane protein
MDSLTHLVLGAAMGEALMGRRIGKKAMLWGALANSLPDIDVLAVPFFHPPLSLAIHRGITHSILFCCLSSWALAWYFSRRKWERQASRKQWLLFFLVTVNAHILLDSFTAYGTGWFEPFSHARVSFNTIFVADLFYTLPLLVCVIRLLRLPGDSPRRKAWNRAGLILSSAYLVFTFAVKLHVDSKVEMELQEGKVAYSDYFTTPTPLNDFLWMCTAKDSGGYYIGYYSIFDRKPGILFHYVSRGDALVPDTADKATFEQLKWFSRGYYTITKTDSTVDLNDLYFGQFPGWSDPQAPYAFSYNLVAHGRQQPLNRGRLKGSISENFVRLIRRIRGR